MGTIVKGMHLDQHPDQQPEGTFRDCYDGMLSADGLNSSWTPILGNAEFSFTSGTGIAVSVSKMLGIVTISDRTYRIVLSGTLLHILLSDEQAASCVDICSIDATVLFGTSNLSSVEVKSAFGYSDGNGSYFIYLSSGVNQPICVNVSKPVGAVSIESCRYLPEIGSFSVSASRIVGALPCGAYSYSVQLYNEDGTTSQWSIPTRYIELFSSKQIAETVSLSPISYEVVSAIDMQNINGMSGGGTSDPSVYGVQLTISGIPAWFTRMRIAYFNRGKDGASTVGYICYDGLVSSGYSHTIQNKLRSMLVSDITIQPTELHNVNSMEFSMDVQVAGGFDELDGINDANRWKVSNGYLISSLMPTLTEQRRKVKNSNNEDVDPFIAFTENPIFAPTETYEIALQPVTKAGTYGNPIRAGRITMSDYAQTGNRFNVALESYTASNPVIGLSASTYMNRQAVADIVLSNLDLSIFADSSIDRVNILFRNVSNRVVGYGLFKTPVQHNDANAGGILPRYESGLSAIPIYNNFLTLHIPEHLFGAKNPSDFKDMEVEFMDSYSYKYESPGYMSMLVKPENDSHRSNLHYLGKRAIAQVLELGYSNENNITMDGLPGARRNSTAVDGTRAWGYGQKSLLVKLANSYPSPDGSLPSFGICRIVNPLASENESGLYSYSGVSIRLSDCTISDVVVDGKATKRYLAPSVTLTVGDRYARRFIFNSIVGNFESITKVIFEKADIPIYSSLDVAARVGAHNGTLGETTNTFKLGIAVHYGNGYSQLESFQLHDHYKESVGAFAWSSIQEKLRTSMQQHVRWAVKRVANSRVDELRRFLPADIAAASLSGGSIVALRFIGNQLYVMQQSYTGRMPYNEKVPLSKSSEVFMGTGKEFMSYYPVIMDGVSSYKKVARLSSDLALSLTKHGEIVVINDQVTTTTDLGTIELLRLMGISSLSGNTPGADISITPSVDGHCYITINDSISIVAASGIKPSTLGVTSALKRFSFVKNRKLYTVDDSGKTYVHLTKSDLNANAVCGFMYGRQVTPTLTLVVNQETPFSLESIVIPNLKLDDFSVMFTYESDVVTSGVGHFVNALEMRNHRFINNGWKLTVPRIASNGYYRKLFGTYIKVKFTFDVSSNEKLRKFGYVNTYGVSLIAKL